MSIHKIQSAIPKLICRLRLEKDLTQEELAQLAKLDRTYISGVERGVRNMSLKSLAKILSALELDTKNFAAELIFQDKLKSNSR